MCVVMLLLSVLTAGREIRLGDGKYECRHRDCEERVDPIGGLSAGICDRPWYLIPGTNKSCLQQF